jgi:hypothetical protein
MSVSALPWSAWLAQASAFRDTVVVIPADQGWADGVIAVSQLLVSIAVLALLVGIVFALLALRKGVQELTKLIHSSYGDVSAATHSIRNVAEDVRGVTQTLRTEVEAIGGTLHVVNDGVRAALGRAQDRLERLDALAAVAQEEAEDFVVSSAATLRGFRFGAGTLRKSFGFARGNGSRRMRRRRLREEAEARLREEAGAEHPRIRTRSSERQ